MTEIFRFRPLLQPTIWGGNRISVMKGVSSDEAIGESWEISGIEGKETVVAEGQYQGLGVNELADALKERLLGRANYERFGSRFPLLIKFIDACRDLSIQVHPDDETAHRHGLAFGKTEMWYVMPSSPGARLYNGLRRQTDAEQLRQMVADKTITEALSQYEVSEGDVFFIPAGRIHAIGTGCMVAEIQQTSDTTYRLYDYDRRDANGNPRQLHVEQAAECIDYRMQEDYRTRYQPTCNQPTTVVSCPYFTTSVMPVSGKAAVDCSAIDSFIIVMAVSGEGSIDADGTTVAVQTGQTILLPATAQHIEACGDMTVLLIWI